MAELLKEIRARRERVAEMRKALGPPTEAEKRESRVRSVYASLAIEDPSVTLEGVRTALKGA